MIDQRNRKTTSIVSMQRLHHTDITQVSSWSYREILESDEYHWTVRIGWENPNNQIETFFYWYDGGRIISECSIDGWQKREVFHEKDWYDCSSENKSSWKIQYITLLPFKSRYRTKRNVPPLPRKKVGGLTNDGSMSTKWWRHSSACQEDEQSAAILSSSSISTNPAEKWS